MPQNTWILLIRTVITTEWLKEHIQSILLSNALYHWCYVIIFYWNIQTHTHTHTRLMDLCPGLPGWAGTKKKSNLDFTEARDSEWQWHQQNHMQVCTSLQADNHASTPALSFLQAGCPSCHPTNSVKALKANRNIQTPNPIWNIIVCA